MVCSEYYAQRECKYTWRACESFGKTSNQLCEGNNINSKLGNKHHTRILDRPLPVGTYATGQGYLFILDIRTKQRGICLMHTNPPTPNKLHRRLRISNTLPKSGVRLTGTGRCDFNLLRCPTSKRVQMELLFNIFFLRMDEPAKHPIASGCQALAIWLQTRFVMVSLRWWRPLTFDTRPQPPSRMDGKLKRSRDRIKHFITPSALSPHSPPPSCSLSIIQLLRSILFYPG